MKLRLLSALIALQGFAAGNQRPNILFILVDDVGYADINAFGAHLRGTSVGKHYRETPRIDQLAREGMMFTQFYAKMIREDAADGLRPLKTECLESDFPVVSIDVSLIKVNHPSQTMPVALFANWAPIPWAVIQGNTLTALSIPSCRTKGNR